MNSHSSSNNVGQKGRFAVVRENHNFYEFTKFHETYELAQKEAERLCRKEKASFYVMEAKVKCYVQEQPITWVELY